MKDQKKGFDENLLMYFIFKLVIERDVEKFTNLSTACCNGIYFYSICAFSKVTDFSTTGYVLYLDTSITMSQKENK